MKIIISMTKKKAHFYIQNKYGAFFMVLWILALWVMDIYQFAFTFPVSLNAKVMNT